MKLTKEQYITDITITHSQEYKIHKQRPAILRSEVKTPCMPKYKFALLMIKMSMTICNDYVVVNDKCTR